VGDRVGIGVPREAARSGNTHPCQDQRPRIAEPVGVVADADSQAATSSSIGE
jgi:hypothetical protein